MIWRDRTYLQLELLAPNQQIPWTIPILSFMSIALLSGLTHAENFTWWVHTRHIRLRGTYKNRSRHIQRLLLSAPSI